jgi:hypothetical protein
MKISYEICSAVWSHFHISPVKSLIYELLCHEYVMEYEDVCAGMRGDIHECLFIECKL